MPMLTIVHEAEEWRGASTRSLLAVRECNYENLALRTYIKTTKRMHIK